MVVFVVDVKEVEEVIETENIVATLGIDSSVVAVVVVVEENHEVELDLDIVTTMEHIVDHNEVDVKELNHTVVVECIVDLNQ